MPSAQPHPLTGLETGHEQALGAIGRLLLKAGLQVCRVDRVTLDLRGTGWPLLPVAPSRPAAELWIADRRRGHLATVTVGHPPEIYHITSGETVDLAPSAEQATAVILSRR